MNFLLPRLVLVSSILLFAVGCPENDSADPANTTADTTPDTGDNTEAAPDKADNADQNDEL